MIDHCQWLRERTLEMTAGKPVRQRADALNLIENIIQADKDDFDVDKFVEAIANGELIKYYKPEQPA